MTNPYALRWATFAQGEEPLEAEAIRNEVREAEDAEVLECGNCGEDAFYRPGVGAHQCWACKSLLIIRRIDEKFVEEWIV